MHGLQVFGEYVFEVFVVSLLLAASALLVIPFIPMFIGVIGFFKSDKKTRRFKDIFTTIGSSFGTIAIYTIFELVIILFPILNIYFFNTHPESTNYFVLAVCVVALVVGVIYLINGPIIIVNMQVGFRQLLYNGFMLLFGGLFRSVLALGVIGGVVALIMFYPYVLPLTLYAVPYALSKLLTENFYVLKAKALKTSVYELKHNIGKDDYINENGEVNHDEKK
ncbi:MAG: hypothetical protein J1F71_05395 [Clostridiales bacterium]|nr:hypothetical protein [Clostridiales bacterium]